MAAATPTTQTAPADGPTILSVTRDGAGMAHIVALSGGKDSTAMALRLREVSPGVPFTFVCTPTGDELPEMLAHWAKLETLLGSPLIRVERPGGLAAVIEQQGALPNARMRFCTRLLKLDPFRRFAAKHAPFVSYVGIRADEDRDGDVQSEWTRFPLTEWGWGEAEVWKYLGERGVSIPERTDCARCFYQKLGEWWKLWKLHPGAYASAEADEAKYGHTYRSPSRDTWPAALKDLRAEFERGRKPDVSLRMMEKRSGMCRVCAL